ncbi:MAG: type II secretion system protein [Candidatus Nomurabacteria bacterium]|nr:MAG: type II secretion system protein [Candidatus Nomurabacteria bacterium]
MKNTSGFTLIELLIVIAIIGILSSIVIALNYETVRAKTRDTERVSWLNDFADALVLYYDDNQRYPGQRLGVGGATYTFPAGNNYFHFHYGYTQLDGSCTGNYPNLKFENSASDGFLDILYPDYINITGFFDPLGQEVQDTPYNCRYVVQQSERDVNNVQSYLMHCRIEKSLEYAEGDSGTAPLYFERSGGNPPFCLVDHNTD